MIQGENNKDLVINIPLFRFADRHIYQSLYRLNCYDPVSRTNVMVNTKRLGNIMCSHTKLTALFCGEDGVAPSMKYYVLIKLTNKSANSKLFDSYGISNHNGSLGEITIKTNQGELNLSMKKFIKYTQNKCNTCGDTDICYDNPFRFGIEFLGTT